MSKKLLCMTLSTILMIMSLLASPLTMMNVYAGVVALPSGYVTDENNIMAYAYKDYTFDVYGYKDSWLRTTFANEGFFSYLKCDDAELGSPFSASSDGANVDGFNVKINFSFANEGKLLGVTYTVKNNNDTEKVFSLGSCADVQIGDDDSASITPFDDGSGFKMVNTRNGDDKDSQFNFFGKDCLDATDVDAFWYGRYSQYAGNMSTYVFKNDERESGNFDSAMSYSWHDRTIAAGETQTFKVYIGIGGKGSESIGGKGDNEDKCTVTFVNQGTTMSAIQVTSGSAISTATTGSAISIPTPPSRNGYIFRGWYTGENGTGIKFTEDTIVLRDMTLYAYWTVAYVPENSTTPSKPTAKPVIVDGVEYNIGEEKVEGDTTTITVDKDKLSQNIQNAEIGSNVIIPVSSDTNKTVVQIVVKNVDEMAEKDLTLVVRVGDISYNIPTSAIDTNAIIKKLDGDAKDIPFSIIIEKADEKTQASVNTIAARQGFDVVVGPVDFSVKSSYNGQTVEIEKFNNYVAREIEITKEQAKKITTAIVTEKDGSVRHIPTFVYSKDGKYFTRINSRTNSLYTLIHNEVEFGDASGKWYEDTVNEMAGRKIINGKEDNMFAGDDSITRAEFAAIIVRALGLPTNNTTADRFTDIDKDAWYYGAVGTAYEYDLVKGKDANQTVFDPMADITREEAMAMVQRAAKVAEFNGVAGSDLTGFGDASFVSSWAKAAVEFNISNAFIVGSNGNINPKSNITRAETATVILRLLQKSNLVDIRTNVTK